MEPGAEIESAHTTGRMSARNQRIELITRAWSARQRQPRQKKHRGPITRAFLDVLEALLWGFHNSRSGACFPSYEMIAEKAECARSTVAEALKVLEWAGVLTWQNRIARIQVRERDLFGQWASRWRVIRASNAYVFSDPKPQLAGVSACKSENATGTRNQDILNLRLAPASDPNSPLERAYLNPAIVSSAFVRMANGVGVAFASSPAAFVRRSAVWRVFRHGLSCGNCPRNPRRAASAPEPRRAGSSRGPSCRRRTRSNDGSNRAVGLLEPSDRWGSAPLGSLRSHFATCVGRLRPCAFRVRVRSRRSPRSLLCLRALLGRPCGTNAKTHMLSCRHSISRARSGQRSAGSKGWASPRYADLSRHADSSRCRSRLNRRTDWHFSCRLLVGMVPIGCQPPLFVLSARVVSL